MWGSTWILLAAVGLLAGRLLLSAPWPAVAAWGGYVLRDWGAAWPVTLAGALLTSRRQRTTEVDLGRGRSIVRGGSVRHA